MRPFSAVNAVAIFLLSTPCIYGEYDAEHGRFFQRDPRGMSPEPGIRQPAPIDDQYGDGMNLYEYVASNPTKWVDPFGKEIVGISGFLQSPQTMSQIVSSIQQQVNVAMKRHGFSETRTKLIGGGGGGPKSRAVSLFQEWVRRKEKEWKKYGCDKGEQFVLVGHSDGATAIWQISHDGKHRAGGSNSSKSWNMAYMGMIDMVRKDFLSIFPNTKKNEWVRAGQARLPTQLENYHQDTGKSLEPIPKPV